MRAGIKVPLFVLGAIALFGLILFLTASKEPSYHGRSLSQWISVSRATGSTPDQRIEAAQAIRQMGTNALPLLLAWATNYPPRVSPLKVYLSQHPSLTPGLLRQWAAKPPDGTRAMEARLAFLILRSNAAPIIPQLVQVANKLPPTEISYWALSTLANIGPAGLSALLQIAGTGKPAMRSEALRQIAELGTNATQVLPQLIGYVDDPEPLVRAAATRSLGHLRLCPELCVPALTKCLEDPDRWVRLAAAIALSRFGTNAAAAVPKLEAAVIVETDPSIAQQLLWALRQLTDPNHTYKAPR